MTISEYLDNFLCLGGVLQKWLRRICVDCFHCIENTNGLPFMKPEFTKGVRKETSPYIYICLLLFASQFNQSAASYRNINQASFEPIAVR